MIRSGIIGPVEVSTGSNLPHNLMTTVPASQCFIYLLVKVIGLRVFAHSTALCLYTW